MIFAKNRVEEGYPFSAVNTWLHEKYDEKTKQAKYVVKNDIANVGQKWRRANPDYDQKLTIEDPLPPNSRQNVVLTW